MKIAIINNLYHPYNRGGAENVVREMITELRQQGHEVFLITTKPPKLNYPAEFTLPVYQLPSRYYQLAEYSYGRRLWWQIANVFSYRQTRRLKKILLTEQPQLVMTHNLMGLGFRTPRLIKKLGIRHEHYLHDIQLLHPSGLMLYGQEGIINSPLAKLYQFFTRHFFGSPQQVISPSAWLLALYQDHHFFPHSPSSVRQLSSPPTDNLPVTKKRNKHFLFVGQVEYHKGIHTLLAAFTRARLIQPWIKLSIVGDGTLLTELKKQYQTEKSISFKGRLQPEAVARLMASSYCLIVPSLCYENLPMTILEAKRVGLKVIASNLGGIPEAVSPTDVLVKPGNEEALMKELLRA